MNKQVLRILEIYIYIRIYRNIYRRMVYIWLL